MDQTSIRWLSIFCELKNPDGTYFIPGSSTGSNQNVTFSIPASYAEHQAIGNFDYVLNNKNTLSGRWAYSGDLRRTQRWIAPRRGSTISQCLPGNPAQDMVPDAIRGL
jgi:hypothetical protein